MWRTPLCASHTRSVVHSYFEMIHWCENHENCLLSRKPILSAFWYKLLILTAIRHSLTVVLVLRWYALSFLVNCFSTSGSIFYSSVTSIIYTANLDEEIISEKTNQHQQSYIRQKPLLRLKTKSSNWMNSFGGWRIFCEYLHSLIHKFINSLNHNNWCSAICAAKISHGNGVISLSHSVAHRTFYYS